MRVFTTICFFGVAATWTVAVAPSNSRGETVDLRDGAPTVFYGSQDTNYPYAGDFFGWAMAFGDVDGDGFTDFLSSSFNAEGPNDEHPGHEQDVYLFFGRPREEFDSLYAVDEPGVADIVFYHGGFSMTCADIDDDGYDDVILAEGGGYVIFGAPRDQLRRSYNFEMGHADYTEPDIAIIGSPKLGGDSGVSWGLGADAVTHSLVTGDLNGDGYADVIIGNYLGNEDGRVRGGAVHIILGRARQSFPRVIDADYTSGHAHPDAVIYGDSSEDYPFALVVGDFDGDGVDDLIASTTRGRGEEYSGSGSGEIHGYWGRPNWDDFYDAQIDVFDFALAGNPGDNLGYQLASADLDGDGRDELLAGSPISYIAELHEERRNSGEYRMFFGRPRGTWPKWSNAIEMTDVVIVGAQQGEANGGGPQHWGYAFFMATGNRDGDEYADLLIGAGHGERPDGGHTGKAYLLRGRPRGAWPPFLDLRDSYDTVFYGVDGQGSPGYELDLFGYTTAMADVDNNGLDELFVAAPFADGPSNFGQDMGEVYVIYDQGAATVTNSRSPRPARAMLFPNYPNPFNPSTTFRFRAPPGDRVSLTVYDARGRVVAHPLRATTMLNEEKTVTWEALGRNGRPLPSGIYFVKLLAGNEAHSKKVLLVR